jgi:hypothetical protein
MLISAYASINRTRTILSNSIADKAESALRVVLDIY